MQRRSLLAVTGLAAAAPFLARPALAQAAQIVGAGSTLPQPVYEKWAQLARDAAGIQMTYQPSSGSKGVDQVVARQADFGAADYPRRAALLREQSLIQFPAVLGAVALFVNLPGVQANQLRLTSELIADIFLGRITRWNDPRLAAENKGLRLPDLPVLPVHRSNVSGSTFMFTTYLSRVSDAWREGPRAGTTVQWPAGESAANRDAALAEVRGTPGAISYMEAHFAKAERLATAMLRNRAGAFVTPDDASFAKAAGAADWTPAQFIVEMVDLDAEGAWPIVSPTFIYMPTNPTAEKVEASRNTMKFFDWAFRNASAPTTEMGFVPLPAAVQALVHEAWRRVKGPDGQPVWEA